MSSSDPDTPSTDQSDPGPKSIDKTGFNKQRRYFLIGATSTVAAVGAVGAAVAMGRLLQEQRPDGVLMIGTMLFVLKKG